MNNINWYPGHMKKTRELIEGHLKKVDLVLEVIDARIPVSSKNPVIDSIVLDKPRITVFNKADLSDPKETKKWLRSYREQGISAVAVNSLSGEGFPALYKRMEGLRDLKNKDRPVKRPFRIMVVGIPNVGKSSLPSKVPAMSLSAWLPLKYLAPATGLPQSTRPLPSLVHGLVGGLILPCQILQSFHLMKAG